MTVDHCCGYIHAAALSDLRTGRPFHNPVEPEAEPLRESARDAAIAENSFVAVT
ncbi:MAG: hypothetical protein R6V60_05685 [Desulfobacterales bacterium]